MFNRTIRIGRRVLRENGPCLMLAEIGINHNGSMALARRQINAAAGCGADLVKFQTFTTEEFQADRKAEYTYRNRGRVVKEKLFAMFKRLELRPGDYRRLAAHAARQGIGFMSTPCDAAAVALLDRLPVPALKVSSEDLINTPLLEAVAGTGRPVILSTGMADEHEIELALDVFRRRRQRNVILLHCTSVYPAPDAELNLLRLVRLRERFGTLVGFSDHSRGIDAALGARYLGAVLIEKHFTVSRRLRGPDHDFSSTPAEFGALVRSVRRAEVILGTGAPGPTPTERKLRRQYRRSIVARRALEPGTCLRLADLAYKRPGTGLPPYAAPGLIGRRLRRKLAVDEPILRKDLD